MSNTKTGVELIAEERQRQIEVEGWTDLHNSKDHDGGQMAGAAGCYIANALNKEYGDWRFRFQVRKDGTFMGMQVAGEFSDGWPWGSEWDKRHKHNQMRSLVIAAALIAAEIDRLIALEKQQEVKK